MIEMWITEVVIPSEELTLNSKNELNEDAVMIM